MSNDRGSGLLLLFLICLLLAPAGRELLRREGPPAFFADEQPGVLIGLGDGFPHPGVHRFSDGKALLDVIELTETKITLSPDVSAELSRGLDSGTLLELERDEKQEVKLNITWLPAGQRVALGIPLHPDRMDAEDWEFLSGIGPKLAWAIEKDRQENGDFEFYEALERVRGIGPKRMQAWSVFFQNQ